MPYYIKRTKAKKKDKPLPLFDKAGVTVKKKPDYKKKLDEVFSKYIRLKYAMPNGMCQCISCGSFKHWKEIQNGHYMSRRYMSTRFDEDNCRPQYEVPHSFSEALMLAAKQQRKIEEQQQQIELKEEIIESQDKEIKQSAPKVVYYDTHLQNVKELETQS